MLPQLRRMKEGGAASSPVEHVTMGHEEGSEYGLLDAVAEDLMAAVKADDAKMLKGALEALIEHIKDQDEAQDQELLEDK